MSADKRFVPADARRAAAIITHFGRGEWPGVEAILREAGEVQRGTQLLLGVLALYDEIIPELRTEVGLSILSAHVVRLAGMEHDQGGAS